VLILGGGIAGVAAAKTLHDRGVTNFRILEAEAQLGGRLRAVQVPLAGSDPITVNSGANFIQGYDPLQPDLHPLVQILNAPACGGIEGSFVDYDSIVVRNSQGVDISDSPILRYDDYEAAATASETLREMRRNAALPDISVRQALSEGGWTPGNSADEWVEWLEFDFCFAEPPDNSSLLFGPPLPTYSDFGDPDNTGDFLVTDNEGFVKVVRCLADEFLVENDPRLHLNTRVTRIEWSDDCVCATATVGGSSTRTFCGRYAIMTFSIGVLQQLQAAGLEFSPPLPEETVNAVNSIRMAHYLNIVVELDTRFWEQDIVFIGYVNETDGRYFPLTQELTHVENATVVYMTITDRLADRILRQTEEQNRQEIIAVFNNAYNLTLQPSNILSLFLPDWDINPLFLGAYSNIPVGVSNETFAALRKPLRDRLFISGEATSRNYSGFVHGGYFSGIDTANDVLAEIRSSGEKGVLATAVNLCLLMATTVVTWTLVF
jgi:polyamine oxidase